MRVKRFKWAFFVLKMVFRGGFMCHFGTVFAKLLISLARGAKDGGLAFALAFAAKCLILKDCEGIEGKEGGFHLF